MERIVTDTEGRVGKVATLGAALLPQGQCTLIRIVLFGSAYRALAGRSTFRAERLACGRG